MFVWGFFVVLGFKIVVLWEWECGFLFVECLIVVGEDLIENKIVMIELVMLLLSMLFFYLSLIFLFVW